MRRDAQSWLEKTFSYFHEKSTQGTLTRYAAHDKILSTYTRQVKYMNARERFLKNMNFEKTDRMPMFEWACWWDKTIERWKSEGLKVEAKDGLSAGDALHIDLGLDLQLQTWVHFTTKETPQPAYHGAPIIETLEDYERIKPTLYPENPLNDARMKEYARRQKEGSAVLWLTLEGPFWGPRTLLGIEPHLYAFYDEPELMHQINQDLMEYNMRVYEQVCEYFVPDFMTFAEDMSYNNGPMISEELFNEFMLPYYEQMIPKMKEKGTKVFIDSDGDISMALDWFMRAGIEGILPLERQAGVDLEKLRARYPKCLFIGHYDKMVMPKGEAAMRAEFERLMPVMRQGGFVPSVDHQTPPGVSLENYRIYLRLLNEYAEKAMRG
jgi:uroporphyrinogen-III decarboxylase